MEKKLNSPLTKLFVKNLFHYMRKADVTAYDLEYRAELAHGTIWRWKHLVASPNLISIEKIVKTTGIPAPLWFTTGVSEEARNEVFN